LVEVRGDHFPPGPGWVAAGHARGEAVLGSEGGFRNHRAGGLRFKGYRKDPSGRDARPPSSG
jgi:hypothetical protein